MAVSESKVQLLSAELLACSSSGSSGGGARQFCPRQSPPAGPFVSASPWYLEPPGNPDPEPRLGQGSFPQLDSSAAPMNSQPFLLHHGFRPQRGSVLCPSSACTPFCRAVTPQASSRGTGAQSPESCPRPCSSPQVLQGSKYPRAAKRRRTPRAQEPTLAQHLPPRVTEDLSPRAGSATSATG